MQGVIIVEYITSMVLCIERQSALFQSWQVNFSSLVIFSALIFTLAVNSFINIYSVAGRPYRGKPSDMWALGVVLFTMLYGQFPFYDSIPQELFRKIKAAEYSIPE